MLQSRRGFLIGAGALLTAAFVKDARSFIHRTASPCCRRRRRWSQTLYWYESADEGYQLTLGPWTHCRRPRRRGANFSSAKASRTRPTKRSRRSVPVTAIEPGDFDKPVRALLGGLVRHPGGPCAKAYHLLRRIDLGPERDSGRGPLLEFHKGSHPGDSSHWVNAKDKLSLSLLQARLIDLKMPIKIVEGA